VVQVVLLVLQEQAAQVALQALLEQLAQTALVGLQVLVEQLAQTELQVHLELQE
jgi:hypothetical protein